MSNSKPVTILAISSYFKGEAFLRQAKAEGARVLLLTEEKIAGEKWPRESIDEVFLMPDLSKTQDVINAVSYLYRGQWIDRIVALDEYDIENVATLREHLRLPGMGQTATRFFRDKLAMRMKIDENGILVPPFTGVFNYDRVREYMDRVPPPWVLKPRTEAGAMGIKKINNSEELWRWFDQLGDQQSSFLLEQFIPGDVFHVDSIIWDGEILYASSQQYGQPPMSVAHGGGVFTTRTLPADSDEAIALQKMNAQVIQALGMYRGVTHAEYIRAHEDGRYYFLEIAGRVGGAHISDLIEAASGINPWSEWARIEIASIRGENYTLPTPQPKYGGLLVCLSRQEYPDLSGYQDSEVVWRIDKKNHAGLIVTSEKPERVRELLDQYTERFGYDFLAVAPPKDKPTH
jgi:glutathione synthase/RimK-type ligase-like ATP-grasp enzyme